MKRNGIKWPLIVLSTLLFALSAPALAEDGYQIGSGDILEIVTWKEPDFSRPEVLVRTDGKVTFPLLGDLHAAGRTPVELQKTIESGLGAYVTNPTVTVTVKMPQSKKFYVLGEVMRTGEYDLVKSLTVLQAFALAGGFTEWASKDEILLFRKQGGKDQVFRINYKDIVRGKDTEGNMMIRPDDTILVP